MKSRLKKKLDDLRLKGECCAFDSSKSSPAYNPIQDFLQYVSYRESAHTRILSDLLCNNGRHGMNSTFQKEFISYLSKRDPRLKFDTINWTSITTYSEYTVRCDGSDQNESDPAHKSNRRIDILMKGKYMDGRQFAIVIENKLNGAPFQKDQIDAYRNMISDTIGDRDNVIVVCLHIYRHKDDGKSDILITSPELAEIIENASRSNRELHEVLKSYILYLKYLNMTENALQNAIILTGDEFTGEDINEIRAFHEAYQELPNAYEKKFEEKFKSANNGIKVRTNSSYSYYCDLWHEDEYKASSFWLSVGFYHDKVRFYLVSNDLNTDEAQNKANGLGFGKPVSDKGCMWFEYEAQDSKLPFEIRYADKENEIGKPDFNSIVKTAQSYLELIYSISPKPA